MPASAATALRTDGVADVAAVDEIGLEQPLDDLVLHAGAAAQRIRRCEFSVLGVLAILSKANSMPSPAPSLRMASPIAELRGESPNLALR